MKNLEKNALVQEMSLEENKQIVGGNPWVVAITFAGALIYLYNNNDDFAAGFKEGYQSTQK